LFDGCLNPTFRTLSGHVIGCFRKAKAATTDHAKTSSGACKINFGSCFWSSDLYLFGMELSLTQDYAIQARMAAVLGASEFDRVFTGIRFAEVDGPLLYVYAKDESTAAEIEDDFALLIADLASRILKQEIDVVVVLPKVLQ
jgi:hypothetical protein